MGDICFPFDVVSKYSDCFIFRLYSILLFNFVVGECTGKTMDFLRLCTCHNDYKEFGRKRKQTSVEKDIESAEVICARVCKYICARARTYG